MSAALDALLDARVTHHEIALWLQISEHAVRMRMIEREREAIRPSLPTLRAASKSPGALSDNGAPLSQNCPIRIASLSANTSARCMP